MCLGYILTVVLILMFSVGTPLPAIIMEQQNFKEVSCFMFINSTVAYTTYSNLFLFCTFVYCSTFIEPSCYMAAMYEGRTESHEQLFFVK